MNKDLLTTVAGAVLAAAQGAQEYLAVQNGQHEFGSVQFWIGMAVATGVAVFGYWSKKETKQ
jgi:hypothetical protein